MSDPSVTDELTLRLAEEITKFYRSFDISPRRAQHKAAIQVAIGRAITEQLVIATKREMWPENPDDPKD